MSNKQFGILVAVGVVCMTVIIAVASCVKTIVVTVLNEKAGE